MIGGKYISKNWHLKFRNIIEKLRQKNERLYMQNQLMKRRLVKYEKSRAMVNYYNKKEDK